MKQLTYTPPLCRVYRVALERILCVSGPAENKNKVNILSGYDDEDVLELS